MEYLSSVHRRSVLLALAALAAASAARADGPAAPKETAAPGEVKVASALPVPQLEALLAEALPPPPKTAVVQTSYYGVIRLDHAAHLQRRHACRDCHGSGPVGKIDVTPKVAHGRCIGCHTQLSAGPTACKGCHDTRKPEETPAVTVVAAAASATPPPPPVPTPAQVALLEVAERGPGSLVDLRERTRLVRVIEAGAAAGPGFGPSLRLSSRSGRLETSHTFERLASRDAARTVGLFGFGITQPRHHRLTLVAAALGGFDVIEAPGVAFLPALGARVGMEWAPPASWRVKRFQVSLTGLVDLGRARWGTHEVGGFTGYATLATGLALPGSSP